MPNTPTYILYHGRNTGKEKAGKKIWTRIGAVWPNKSGKGFNLTWDYLPLGVATQKHLRLYSKTSVNPNAYSVRISQTSCSPLVRTCSDSSENSSKTSLCAARICRLVLAEIVRQEVEDNLLRHAAALPAPRLRRCWPITARCSP
jgi:hypothetical protein